VRASVSEQRLQEDSVTEQVVWEDSANEQRLQEDSVTEQAVWEPLFLS
jgi:hypothetical protein